MELTKINFDFHEDHKTLELVDVEGSNFFEKWSRIGNFESDTLKDADDAVQTLIDTVPNLKMRNHGKDVQYSKFGVSCFEFYEFKSTESNELVIAVFRNYDGTSGGDTKIFATEEGRKLLEDIDIETW